VVESTRIQHKAHEYSRATQKIIRTRTPQRVIQRGDIRKAQRAR
jgi:hypothetical protein